MRLARQTDSANWPRLKKSLIGGRRRSSRSVSAGPTTAAMTRSEPLASTRPKTSGTSPSEKEWALRLNSRWTTQRSPTRKPMASHHQATCGSCRGGSPPTGPTNRAPAAVQMARFSHQTGCRARSEAKKPRGVLRTPSAVELESIPMGRPNPQHRHRTPALERRSGKWRARQEVQADVVDRQRGAPQLDRRVHEGLVQGAVQPLEEGAEADRPQVAGPVVDMHLHARLPGPDVRVAEPHQALLRGARGLEVPVAGPAFEVLRERLAPRQLEARLLDRGDVALAAALRHEPPTRPQRVAQPA